MNEELLSRLRCPECGDRLKQRGAESWLRSVQSVSGTLVSSDGRRSYPVRGGIVRFVPESNYADNFGMQWNRFSRTQLDSHSGTNISARRFWTATGWSPSQLSGKWVLDAGCGSGRFAEVALGAGANVVAIDYSNAVDACIANLHAQARLHVVQADIFKLPFEAGSFDFVYSLGVLQHTPNVRSAFESLSRMVKRGGRLCVDYYEKSWTAAAHPKYVLRPITKRLDKERLFSIVNAAIPVMLPISRVLGRVPVAGGLLRRMVPVANHEGSLPLSKSQLREWAVLDTYDWLSPAYDNPQDAATARRWFEDAGFEGIEVLKAGHLVARGQRPD